MKDGSLLIVEDKSRKVLRLFYDPQLGTGAPVAEIPDTVIEDNTNDAKMTANKERLTKILSHLEGNSEFALMPPDGFKDANEKKQMVDLYFLWLKDKGL